MKIVMQHGHAVRKSEIETFLETAPQAWCKTFDSIVVHTSAKDDFRISFHSKERTLAIHLSEEYAGSSSEIIEEIAIALQAIEAHGHLPDKLARQKQITFRNNWLERKGGYDE